MCRVTRLLCSAFAGTQFLLIKNQSLPSSTDADAWQYTSDNFQRVQSCFAGEKPDMPDSTQIDNSKYPDADLADTAGAAGPTPAPASPADLQGSAAAALQVIRGLQNLLCCHATIRLKYT